MALSKEKINIILMRDSGESKRVRMYRSRFRTLVTLCVLSPMVAAAAVAGAYWVWEQNTKLVASNKALVAENEAYRITTTRLQHLEALLKPHKGVERKLAVRIAASEIKEKTIATEVSEAERAKDLQQAGPGHAEFPVVDTGALKVENVACTLVGTDRIRAAFNLRNGGTESIAGEIFCILSLADGKTVPLTPTPAEAGTYKITNFKSAVLFIDLEQGLELVNAEMILEAKDAKGTVIYRNVHPLSQ